MTHAWVELTDADGHDIAEPTDEQLAAALGAVYGASASAVLRFGYDDGLMYEMEVNGDGEVRFEEWSDRDCELALASPRKMMATEDQAIELWQWLAQRQVAKIRALPWETVAS